MKIIWSPLAIDRVSEIAEYIALDKPAAADNWINTLFSKVGQLSPSPLSRQKTWSLKVHSMPARLKVKFFFRMMSSSGTGVIHSHLGAALPRSMAERWLWVTPPLPFVKIPLPLLVHGSRPAL
jgi:plasmid stabilization system protein ParE